MLTLQASVSPRRRSGIAAGMSSERIADVAELLDADPEEIRARYRAIADRVGIMVPGWA